MALLMTEGFEWVDSSVTGSNLENTFETKYESLTNFISGGTDASLVAARGGQALDFGNSTSHEIAMPVLRDALVDSEFIIGWWQKTAAIQNGQAFLIITCGLEIQLAIRCNSDGSFAAYRGNSTLLETSSTGILQTGKWQHIQFKCKISTTAGFVECRIDGVEQWASATNLNTRENTDVFWNALRFRYSGAGNIVDDIYVCDSSGTINNDFLGDVSVTTLFPTKAGTSLDFTTSTGTDHFALIDEMPFTAVPDDTDYVQGLNGQSESFFFDSLPLNNNIHGVIPSAFGKVTDAKSRSAQYFAQVDGIKGLGSNKPIKSDVYKARFDTLETEPVNSQPWQSKDINKAQFGIQLN